MFLDTSCGHEGAGGLYRRYLLSLQIYKVNIWVTVQSSDYLIVNDTPYSFIYNHLAQLPLSRA